jgi:hypothetical protein
MDFDGDDDLAIGAPGEDLGDIVNAGAVHVLYSSPSGGVNTSDTDFLSQDNLSDSQDAQPGDSFGYSLVSADFKASASTEDLAIGVIGEDVGGKRDAGAVEVVYGVRNSGLGTSGQLFTQNTADVEGSAERDDNFGESVAAGFYDQDDHADLAISAPGENLNRGKRGQGAVHVIYSNGGTGAAGLSPSGSTDDQMWSQDSSGVVGSAENNDLFGRSIA